MRRSQRPIGRPRDFQEPRKLTTTVEKEEKTRIERVSKRKGKSKSAYLRELVVADIAIQEGLTQDKGKESE